MKKFEKDVEYAARLRKDRRWKRWNEVAARNKVAMTAALKRETRGKK